MPQPSERLPRERKDDLWFNGKEKTEEEKKPDNLHWCRRRKVGI